MSKPPARLPSSISGHQKAEEENNVEFFVVLCHDLFFEVLQFGNRIQLIKLERAGQKFGRFIGRYFETTPFLLLDLYVKPSEDSEQQLKLVIKVCKPGGTRIEISPSDLTALPPFIRFDLVKLEVAESGNEDDTQSIADKCLSFENLLQSVKPALTESVLGFWGDISGSNPACFHDHLGLLNYVRDRLLTICDKSCGYEFGILFDSDESAAQHVITSILETPQLNRCSNAEFRIYYGSDEPQLRLPIMEISNWLHRNRECDHGRKKLLHICSFRIENFEEMINHLKEAFKHDKSPVPPYTFILNYDTSIEEDDDSDSDDAEDLDEETFMNKQTNEELSVSTIKTKSVIEHQFNQFNTVIQMDRAGKKTKN